MLRRRQPDRGEAADLDAIYSAVWAVTRDVGATEELTVAALVRARLSRRRGAPIARRRLVAGAVRDAAASRPAGALRALEAEEREAVALARFAALDVDQIAAVVGVAAPVVRRRLRDGLRGLARAGEAAA